MGQIGAVLGTLAVLQIIALPIAMVFPATKGRRKTLAKWLMVAVALFFFALVITPEPENQRKSNDGDDASKWLLLVFATGAGCYFAGRVQGRRGVISSAPVMPVPIHTHGRHGVVPSAPVEAPAIRIVLPVDEGDDEGARWFDGEKGELASFTYVDAVGEVTDRVVRNWRSDGRYIRAFCLSARASRTFRKDRIEDWVSPG